METGFKFKRSLVVMGELAQDTARTPPSEDDPPLEYIDRSLTILGRTVDANNQKLQREFVSQREFIASEIREVEKRMDGRLEGLEKRMDGRFEQVDRRFKEVNHHFEDLEKRMNERFEQVDRRFEEVDRRFEQVDRRFDKQDSEIRDIKVQLENAAAITRNGRLRRMHQPLNLIRVLKPTGHLDKFVWASHPQVPKHTKDVYTLGQRAKGVFELGWEGKPREQSMSMTPRYCLKSLSYQLG